MKQRDRNIERQKIERQKIQRGSCPCTLKIHYFVNCIVIFVFILGKLFNIEKNLDPNFSFLNFLRFIRMILNIVDNFVYCLMA